MHNLGLSKRITEVINKDINKEVTIYHILMYSNSKL